MKLLYTAIFFAASTALAGETLVCSKAGVSLSVPEGWALRVEQATASLYPPQSLPKGQRQRRIHIFVARDQSGSLEEAMNSEIDRITERSPAWGSSNDRKHFLGATPVTTRAGLQGLAARFGSGAETARRYEINKFYFRGAEGKIFVVCVHVWGDQRVADDFEKLVLEHLGTP